MASLGTLTAGVAHEINNPLNFISGGIKIIEDLKKDIVNSKSEETKEKFDTAAEMIGSGLNRVSEIIKTLMTFSYRGKPVLVDYKICDIIDNTLLFLNTNKPKDIKIIKEYYFNGYVPIYPDKIHQVILNILENAFFELKANYDIEKKIIITTSQISQTVKISIFNSGPRISDKNINKIFDPFFTTKEPGEGTGLGLSICYSLIVEHKGKVYAENSVNGVTFCIELPLRKN
jgi:signal transduction histidine kinase